ncbi:phosphatidylinositol alpha 1,6-mannosyltransferase [Herbihabitans rhizosphaerae]|uniref:Phosphatidylinositol alpha 1,6-mannosyltransferase n=1 Tax=Herbihabitans rhizosphaerae TaxID=1872711 RepID=A0A4Q7L5B0_9PSEU|nr:glycosyltransferase family 1 protein [Herbihabitans rhizosphaerae]RZS44505.1 phosphatidylinositol alpha 1,6-mannosyltransferase [Herbihabitans rhizosphaerae]
MRVAIVTESFLPQVNGVSNSVLRVVEHLRTRGHQALIVAPGAGCNHYLHAPVVRVPAVDLPVITSLPIGVPSPKVATAIAEFAPDVVHLASPFVLGACGMRAARKLDLPTIAVYQTDVAGFAASYGLSRGARTAWRWIKRLHSSADRTLAPSTAAVRELLAHGIPRVQRWGRGVDLQLFAPTRVDHELRARLAPNGELLVGYVGRLAPEKQVQRLAALNALPGVRVVVVGEGPDERALRKAMPDAAFLGFRTGEALAEAYASLDVFVHTGPHETFCQAVQEAMASGVPVIAPNAGGPRDLVHSGRTGYLIGPDDTKFRAELVSTVERLGDPSLREEMGAAARRAVLGRSWPAVCGELVDHYAEVAGLRAARAA